MQFTFHTCDRPFFPLPKKSAIALPHPSVPKHFLQNPKFIRVNLRVSAVKKDPNSDFCKKLRLTHGNPETGFFTSIKGSNPVSS